VIRLIVATIILTAAVLKAHQLATTPSLGDGLLHARWFNIFVVEFELFFGVWLILGMLPKLTWFATVGCFSVFTLVSFYEAILGEKSCGCFGNVTVNPWVTTIFDISVVSVLMCLRPITLFSFQENFWGVLTGKRFLAIVLFWIVLSFPIIWFCSSFKVTTVGSVGELIDGSNNVILEPAQWIGLKFPLLSFLDNDAVVTQLTAGKKNVVLFRFDCGECIKLIKRISNKDKYVFITIPSKKGNVEMFSSLEYLVLPDKYEWWVETPVVFILENGIVKKVSKDIELNM
jgi:hypothetical protein